MAQAPALSSEISRIVDELQREHDGDPWHGSPLKAILQGIDAQRAAARPLADAHSIWEIVLHMTSWKNETARRIRGAVACMPIEGDWPEAGLPTEDRWQQAIGRLEAAHEDLIAAVKALARRQAVRADQRHAQRTAGHRRLALRTPARHRAARRLSRRPDCATEEGALGRASRYAVLTTIINPDAQARRTVAKPGLRSIASMSAGTFGACPSGQLGCGSKSSMK